MSIRSSAPDRSRSHRLHSRIEQVLSVRPPAHTGVGSTSETSVELCIHKDNGRYTFPMFATDGPGPYEEFRTQRAEDATTILELLQEGGTKQVKLWGLYLIAQVDMDKLVNRGNTKPNPNEFNWQTCFGKSVNLKYSMSPAPHVSIVVKPLPNPGLTYIDPRAFESCEKMVLVERVENLGR